MFPGRSISNEFARANDYAVILCVDDSDSMLLICKTALESRGYRVLTASDGMKALGLLQRYAVDAAVIDNDMPGMSGRELASAIKRADNLPILMFSGSDTAFPMDSIDSFLSKGNGPRAMCDAVGELLKNTRRKSFGRFPCAKNF